MKRLARFIRYRRNWIGLILVGGLFCVALATPSIAPQKDADNPENFIQVGRRTDLTPRPPNEKARLGTLSGQYDVLFTLLWGLRQAFKFGLTVTLVTAAFGMVYGASSAYLGGRVNNTLMRIADALLAIPVIAAVVFIQQIFVILLEKTGVFLIYLSTIPLTLTALQRFLLKTDPVMWSLILLSWMPYARLVNASVLRLRNTEFVQSAKALGAGHTRIIFRHLLPNAISPEIVMAARDVGGMVILQATFTFIGIRGGSAWGELLARARDWVVGPGGNPFVYWWTYLPTTLVLILFGVSWNFLGDSLNEWLNPRKQA